MQSLMRQNEPKSLLRCQAVLHQRQIQVLVAAVNLVANDGMAEVREVDAELVLAASARDEAKEGKR